MEISRETAWEANGKHSSKKAIPIKDLEDSHIVNICLWLPGVLEQYGVHGSKIQAVINEEVELRGLSEVVEKGEYLPYTSYVTGEMILAGDC